MRARAGLVLLPPAGRAQHQARSYEGAGYG